MPGSPAVVPEQLARRFNVVPVGQTDSYLEVATANPFDIDAEKMLAFATGREVRMLLASPGEIRAKLDEIYRGGEDVVSRLLEGIGERLRGQGAHRRGGRSTPARRRRASGRSSGWWT